MTSFGPLGPLTYGSERSVNQDALDSEKGTKKDQVSLLPWLKSSSYQEDKTKIPTRSLGATFVSASPPNTTAMLQHLFPLSHLPPQKKFTAPSQNPS